MNNFQSSNKIKKYWFRTLILALFFSVLPPLQTAQAAVLTRPASNLGLVGYWPLDEGRGSVGGDMSGSGNSGTLSAGSWTSGKRGNGMNFNGASAGVSVPQSPSLNNIANGFTLSVWVKFNQADRATDGYDWQGIATKGGWGNWFGLMLCTDPLCAPAKTLRFYHSGLSPATSDYSWSDVQVNTWYLVAVVYDGQKTYHYINGVLKASAPVTGTPTTNSNNLNFGNGGALTNYPFDGSMDDLKIYNRALSSSEIAKLYSSGQATRKVISNQGLLGYWSMNEGVGSTAGDSSGNNNTGNIVGAVWTSGKRGKSLDFTSTNNKFAIPSTSVLDTDVHTIAFWLKFNYTATNWDQIFAYRPSGSDRSPGIWTNPAGDCLHWRYNPGNMGADCVGPGGDGKYFTPGIWYYITGVKSGSVFDFYVNGNKTGGSYTVPAMKSPGNAPIELGQTGYNSAIFSIDDLRVYNRALSAAEIQSLYQQTEAKINSSQNAKLTSGLAGLWSFDGPDISGSTAYDRSGNGNNGTINGATKTIGKIGQGLYCNNSINSQVNISDIATVGSSGTYSLWIKPADVNVQAGLIDSNFDIFLWDGNLIYFRAGNQTAVSTASWESNSWHHVAMTWNGTNYFGYIDGVQVVTNGIQTGSRSGNLYLCKVDAGFYYKGSIDETRIYSRALSASEVKQLYDMGK